MSSRISGNFWGEGGFPVVSTFHKTGMKNIDHLAAIFTERASIESDYVKQLQKLSKKLGEIVEQGRLADTLGKIKEEVDGEATQRSQFVTELKTHAATLGAVQKEVKKASKSPLGEAEKANKEYHTLSSNITKAKAKYDKACQENAANDAKVRQEADPKLKAKLESAQQKLAKAQTSAEQEYQASIQKLTSYQPQYEEKLRTAYDALQDCEIQRAEAMKSGCSSYCSSLRVMENTIPTAISAISSSASSINTNADLESWINSNRTFTSPPPPPKFEPFGTVSAPAATPATRSSATLSSATTSSSTAGGSASTFTSPKTLSSTSSTTFSRPPATAVPPAPVEEATGQEEEYAAEYGQEEYAEEAYGEEYGEEYAGEEEYAPGAGYGEVVTAAWDYAAKEANELSFKANESITIISKDDEGWWTGTNEAGESGLFPSNYVNA